MSTAELIERIKTLTPEQQRQIANQIDRLTSEDQGPPYSMDLVTRFRERRERMERLYGPFENNSLEICRLREAGR